MLLVSFVKHLTMKVHGIILLGKQNILLIIIFIIDINRVLKGKKLSEELNVRAICDELRSQQVPSPHLLSTLIDIYEEEAEKGNQESLTKALDVSLVLSVSSFISF